MLKKWSFIYAYKIEIVFEIFLYVFDNAGTTKENIYLAMSEGIISPRNKSDLWEKADAKKKDRNKLEYLHACEYLNFITKSNDQYYPDLTDFKKTKLELISYLRFHNTLEAATPNLKKDTSEMLIQNYPVAKNFFSWFKNFNLNSDHSNGIYFFQQNVSKGSDYALIDNNFYLIPKNYHRMIDLFKAWFINLGSLETIFLPLKDVNLNSKILDINFSKYISTKKEIYIFQYYYLPKESNNPIFEISNAINNLVIKKRNNVLSLTELIVYIAQETKIAHAIIKDTIVLLAQKEPSIYYLERLSEYYLDQKSLHHMENVFIKYNGFYRNRLIVRLNNGK